MINVFTQLLMACLFSIAATASPYTQAIGLKAVYYSGASYCKPSSLKNWNCGKACSGSSVTRVTPFDDGWANYGFVGYNARDKQIIVSFKGISPYSLLDWSKALNFNQVKYPGVRGAQVHSGFYKAYNSV
jgi:hypothetical protein